MTSDSRHKVQNDKVNSELYLKTEQLLFFRLTFALASLGLVLSLQWFVGTDFDIASVIALTLGVVTYSTAAVLFLRARRSAEGHLNKLNAAFLALDIASLAGLVYYTHGADSDLYFLFLLPIFLASYTFSRRGIFATALAVALAYLFLMLAANASFLPFLLDSSKKDSLAYAYAQRLWAKIFWRWAVLTSVAFIWGAFCEYMSRVAQEGANRLRDQLQANEKLVAETRAQAAREYLINSISSALRSTLDLDQILNTTSRELMVALNVSRCAIICPAESPVQGAGVWQSLDASSHGDARLLITEHLCSFLLEQRSMLEQTLGRGSAHQTVVLSNPEEETLLKPVKADLSGHDLKSLILQSVMYGAECKGILLILSNESARRWHDSELELIAAVADQVAIAIEHARLVEQLSRKNRDLLQKNLHLDAKNLELRQVQSKLVHQEKMASLGRLVAGIAHELNNPVNFVHGNLPYLRQYFQDVKSIIDELTSISLPHRELVEELKKRMRYDFLVEDIDNILDDLGEGAERIRQITRNLRSFSRLDEAELKEASVQEGLESTVKLLNQYYGRDKIPLELDISPLPAIVCYPGQLNQVWMNLLSNAAEALEGTPDPMVKVAGKLLDESWIIVSIHDNGPGIKGADQSKIFEPFFTTKAVGRGTGLGLSICHSIVERHGGQIWFECAEGSGTTFHVKIPLKTEVSQKVQSAPGNEGASEPVFPESAMRDTANAQPPQNPGR